MIDSAKKMRILLLHRDIKTSNRLEDYIMDRFFNAHIIHFNDILHAFHEVVHGFYDIIIIDSKIEGFKNFEAIKLIKSFAPNIPIIVTCDNSNRADALQSVVDGASNYYIIRPASSHVLIDMIAVELKLVSPLDYVRSHSYKIHTIAK